MKSDTGSELVFVYGTLRRGGSNAFRMDGAEFVGRGEVAGDLVVISWYPGLVPGAADRWVQGELYYVTPEHLRALDEYEGLAAGEVEGSEYRRARMKAYPFGSRNSWGEAWVWQWKGPFDPRRVVKSGDWMDYQFPRPFALFTSVGFACLIAYFVFLANTPDPHTRLTPPGQVERVLVQVVHGAPVMVFLFAWIAIRRRERWEVFGKVIFVFSGLLAGLVVVGLIGMVLDKLP